MIRVIACCLNVFGVIIYLAISWLGCTICYMLRQQHNANQKRLLLVSQLQSFPFSQLAFDNEMQCIICFTNFEE